MIVAESFLRTLIKIYGRHIVYSDGWNMVLTNICISFRLEPRLHSPYKKSIV